MFQSNYQVDRETSGYNVVIGANLWVVDVQEGVVNTLDYSLQKLKTSCDQNALSHIVMELLLNSSRADVVALCIVMPTPIRQACRQQQAPASLLRSAKT